MANSEIPSTVNPDLQKERNAASFKVEEFATWWYNGADNLKFKRELENYIYDGVNDDIVSVLSKSHDDIYDVAIRTTIEAAKKLRNLQQERNPGGTDIFPKLLASPVLWGVMPAGNPFAVHFTMMVTALRGQATDEQFEKWGKRAEQLEICGTYAQTELGHGTFLRGLETRADYDRTTQEFVLNTPTLTSYKWWPGGLGHSSNYCIVVANMYIDNDKKGVHMFMVPVRDEETHLPLPGIDIGDIGKKMGFIGVNNGYLGLKNVRVPRNNMLMRNAQVLEDGSYVKSPVGILTYFTMVYVRCAIAKNNAFLLGMAATIATRYSAVRRQSPINPNEPEPQIMDHVTQQLKLFPEIAATVAYRLAADVLWSLYEKTSADIKQGEYSRLPEMHALSCIMKVLSTSDSATAIERLRLACGGHGYMAASNLGSIYTAATAACTYEGENTVLLLQVGRFLMKSWSNALEGKQLVPTVQYIATALKQKEFGTFDGSWECLVRAMQFTAANKTRLAFENLSQRLKSGQTKEEAANNTGIEYIQAAELHGRAFVCSTFLEQVSGPVSKARSPALNEVLQNLLELFLVNTTLKHMNDVLRFVNITNEQLRELQFRLEVVLKKIRPNAVTIVDGFDYHDKLLSSALGAYDGNVYERLFQSAKNSPLNKELVPKSFHTILKPFLRSNM